MKIRDLEFCNKKEIRHLHLYGYCIEKYITVQNELNVNICDAQKIKKAIELKRKTFVIFYKKILNLLTFI